MGPQSPRACAIALLLLVAAIASVVPTASAATTRAFTATTATAGPATAFRAFDAHPPKAFDFDGDGRMELILHNDNRRVYVFDSRTGDLRAELTTRYPSSWGARPINGPEAAVMRPGERPHLVVANSAGYVTDFRYDGTAANGTFIFTKVWERRLKDCHSSPGMDARVALVDLDKDGTLEILGQVEQVGLFALHANGTLKWKKCVGGGNADPSYGDTNNDGYPEAVFFSDAGVVRVYDGRTGKHRWGFWAGDPKYNLTRAPIPVGGAVTQLDGTGGADVVVGVGDKHNCTDPTQNHAALFALRHDGKLLWMRQAAQATPLTYTHPAVVDADRDGRKEIYWATWNTQGHKCGSPSYQVIGKAHAFRFEADGAMRWATQLNTFWSNDDLAIADVDGDGAQEVLAVGVASNGHEGVYYLNVRTGEKETFVDAYPYKVMRGPIVGKLWGNGDAQWFVPVGPYRSGSAFGVQVYDTGVTYRADWPHLPYPNGGDDVPVAGTEPDGAPTTTEPDAGAGSTFEATFELSPNINAWWVEVWVTGDRSIASVDARVDGGAWVALALKEWGSWAKSFHVASGSSVEFRAADADGAAASSQAFAWP